MNALSQLAQPKTMPLKSIKLQAIDQSNPEHGFKCPCDMCKKYENKKVQTLLDTRTKIVNQKIRQRLAKHPISTNIPNLASNLSQNNKNKFIYKTFLKFLLHPANKILVRPLQLYTTETLFYKNGQASLIICNKQWDEPILKKIARDTNNGNGNEAIPNKINNNLIQKIFNDRRRKYNNAINLLLGKKKNSQNNQSKGKNKGYIKNGKDQKKETKKNLDGAVKIVYLDDSQQLINEQQFIGFLQKRKLDPIWQQINYIKNYIHVENQLERIIVVKYNYEDVQYISLFERARQLMKAHAANSHPGDSDYISERQEQQFCANLCKQSLNAYAAYTLYKMIKFAQFFHDQLIKKAAVKFIINQQNRIYFDNVYKLETEQLFKFSWTNEVYLNKIKEQEQKVFYSKSVEKFSANEKRVDNAHLIENTMDHIYEKNKAHYGLSMQVDNDDEQRANNRVFRYLHPEIEKDFTEILKDQTMTVNKFKKDYLGYKAKKKPIVTPFNSNMLKVLHQTTPLFHQSQPHQYLSIPKRSVSTSFSGYSRKQTRGTTKYSNSHLSLRNQE